MSDVLKVPVTVITGFLGSGKTTLITQLMRNTSGKRLASLQFIINAPPLLFPTPFFLGMTRPFSFEFETICIFPRTKFAPLSKTFKRLEIESLGKKSSAPRNVTKSPEE